MSIIVRQLSYIHTDKDVLFQDINFSIAEGQKVALVGDNGSGKSTLMQMLTGRIKPSSGEVIMSSAPYYVPQHFGQYNHQTVAQALSIDKKLEAYNAILRGDASEDNFVVLDDDWGIEERANAALSQWQLDHITLEQTFDSLSGGEKTRVFLAGVAIHEPRVVLMDEPSNHLDNVSRHSLYKLLQQPGITILVISHDRTMLNLLPDIYELDKRGVTVYGGNYEFYKEQKELEEEALEAKLDENMKQLRQAKKVARETAERQQKRDVRSSKGVAKAGLARIVVNMLKNKAENSTAKQKEVHNDKIGSINETIKSIQKDLPDIKAMKVDFNTSELHAGKILITGDYVNFGYTDDMLWNEGLNFQVKSGERIAIMGANGSGKTTLIRLMLGIEKPTMGTVTIADLKYVYLDQEYSIIDNALTVIDQVRQYNEGMDDSDMKIILNRFLFPYDTWNKACSKLSGGEKMKLALCCLVVGANTPDVLVLDEPTNNIDIRNVEILISTIREYKGTVLVISHDEYFLDEIGVDYAIEL